MARHNRMSGNSLSNSSVPWLLRSLAQVGKETHQVLGVIGRWALAPFGLEVIGKVQQALTIAQEIGYP